MEFLQAKWWCDLAYKSRYNRDWCKEQLNQKYDIQELYNTSVIIHDYALCNFNRAMRELTSSLPRQVVEEALFLVMVHVKNTY